MPSQPSTTVPARHPRLPFPARRRLGLALTVTLLLSPAAQAQVISPTAAADIAKYVKQMNDWITTIQGYLNLKDKLFASSQWEDLVHTLKTNMARYAGLNNINLSDLQALYKNALSLQSRVSSMRGDIQKQSQDLWKRLSAAALDPGDVAATMVGLAPDLQVAKEQAALTVAQTNNAGQQTVQRTADSASALNNSMDTARDTAQRSVTSVSNSADLVQSASNAQSTRDATVVVARGIAELVADSALNNAAITTALAQQAKQTQVLNGAVNTLVDHQLAQLQSQAREVTAQVDATTRAAKQQGQNVANAMDSVGSAYDNVANQDLHGDIDAFFGGPAVGP
ncbi:hypothetical protein [Deinococcus sonorensis]|uniref:Uncharacterized protein n=1 Tax=Deinococcus sonorensis TaxID=309891 RepID=A0ABV8YB84_9DEIO